MGAQEERIIRDRKAKIDRFLAITIPPESSEFFKIKRCF